MNYKTPCPGDRQVQGPDQVVRGQVRRLAPRGDRLDDIGGEEGQRQEAAEVAIADPFDPGEFGDAAGLTRDERLETAVRPA
jgi:hypothetical protein